MMKAGDPILRLSNTELELQLINQQTAVFNLLTQMEIARNAAQQNMITNQNSLADAENNLIEATRVYNLDSHLYAEKAIGFQEYQSAKNLHEYQERKKKLMEQVLSEDSLSQEQQLTQAKQSYQGSQRSLDLMRQEVGELIVRAPVDGELTSLDAEIGENKNKGERLGQIDMVNGFKVQVQPDEHYIDRIYDGLTGTFSYADSTYNLKIKKIYTEVVDARFQVDMSFVGKAPTGLRRGQTLQVLLALSDAKQAILLPRGGFFEQTGGNWIFKLSKDGKTASRVNIQLGSMNPDYYEVLSGLKPGDKVITSSYDTYGNVQTLVLNK